MPNVQASESNTGSPAAETSPRVEHAFERFLEPVFHYVSRRVPGREEAEDITAEVFAVLAQSRPRLPGEAALYLWLLGIARRKIADALRRRQRRPETPASQLSPPGRRGDADAPGGSTRLEEAAGAGESPEEC